VRPNNEQNYFLIILIFSSFWFHFPENNAYAALCDKTESNLTYWY